MSALIIMQNSYFAEYLAQEPYSSCVEGIGDDDVLWVWEWL